MRLNLVFTLLLFSTATTAGFAQDLNGEWTNGWQEYSIGQVNDTLWTANGADLHEGGLRFALRRLSDSSWLLKGHTLEGVWDDRAQPIVGKKGDRVFYRVVDGHRVLVFQSVAGTIDDIFVPMEKDQKLEDLVIGDKISYQLGGEYVDTRNGKPVVFYPGRPEVTGLFAGSQVYYFPAPYDFPDDVLIFQNKTSLMYHRTDSSLELKVAVDQGNEEYTAGKTVTTLRRTGWLDPSRSHLPGRYPFASVVPLTNGLLHYFSSAERRIMRNEIYARHGYIFKSPELQAYFTAQPWYKPVEGAGEAQLTELEKLNTRILAEAAANRH